MLPWLRAARKAEKLVLHTRGQERHGKSCGGRAGPSQVRAGLRGAPRLDGSGGARREGARMGFGKTTDSEHLPVNSTDGILKGGERLLQGSEILQRIHPWHWDKRAKSLKGCSLNHYFHCSALGICPFPPLDSAGKEIQCSQACLIKTALQLPLLQGLSTSRVAHLNLKHLCCLLPPSLRSLVCSSAWLTFVKLTAELLGRANTALQIY